VNSGSDKGCKLERFRQEVVCVFKDGKSAFIGKGAKYNQMMLFRHDTSHRHSVSDRNAHSCDANREVSPIQAPQTKARHPTPPTTLPKLFGKISIFTNMKKALALFCRMDLT